jgi:hypothetical protein
MKNLIVALCVFGMVGVCWGNDLNLTDDQIMDLTASARSASILTSGPTMEITSDGKVLIDNVEIEKLSQPEIVEQLKKIFEEMHNQNRAWTDQCGKQTDYLLRELEECQNKLKSFEGPPE